MHAGDVTGNACLPALNLDCKDTVIPLLAQQSFTQAEREHFWHTFRKTCVFFTLERQGSSVYFPFCSILAGTNYFASLSEFLVHQMHKGFPGYQLHASFSDSFCSCATQRAHCKICSQYFTTACILARWDAPKTIAVVGSQTRVQTSPLPWYNG